MGIFCISSRNVLFATADKEKHDIFLSKKFENGNFPLFSPKISSNYAEKAPDKTRGRSKRRYASRYTPCVSETF